MSQELVGKSRAMWAAPTNDNKAVRVSTEGSGTVHRTARLLAAVVDAEGEISVSSLAHRLNLPNSTVHRLLNLLRHEGFVDWRADNHHYVVGAEFIRIATRLLASVETPELARPHLQTLAKHFGETVIFGLYIPDKNALSFSARVEGTHLLQYRLVLHERRSLLWGAAGRAVLAYLPEQIVRDVLADNPKPSHDGQEPPRLEDLEASLRDIRNAGFSISQGQTIEGACGIAAPVFNHHGVIGCFCMSIPRDRVPGDRGQQIGNAIAEGAAKFSRELGAVKIPARNAKN